MLVFGGESSAGKHSDVGALDLDDRTWARLETTDVLARTDLANVLDATRDRWIVVGGRVGLATSIAEVMALDLSTGVWSAMPGGPSARHDVAGATDGKRAWVF